MEQVQIGISGEEGTRYTTSVNLTRIWSLRLVENGERRLECVSWTMQRTAPAAEELKICSRVARRYSPTPARPVRSLDGDTYRIARSATALLPRSCTQG